MLHFINLIDSYNRRDPAAKSRLETFFTSPGLHAIGFYKISNLCIEELYLFFQISLVHFGKCETSARFA